jgi:hypothetical protein
VDSSNDKILNKGAGSSERAESEGLQVIPTTMAAVSTQNDGFRQAMLKSALNTIPQLTEENYLIWKDKISALLKLRGVLTSLDANNVALTADENA